MSFEIPIRLKRFPRNCLTDLVIHGPVDVEITSFLALHPYLRSLELCGDFEWAATPVHVEYPHLVCLSLTTWEGNVHSIHAPHLRHLHMSNRQLGKASVPAIAKMYPLANLLSHITSTIPTMNRYHCSPSI